MSGTQKTVACGKTGGASPQTPDFGHPTKRRSPMKKHAYRAVPIAVVNIPRLVELLGGERVAVGVDMAKKDLFAVFMDERRQEHITVSWKQPQDNLLMLGLLDALTEVEARVEVAMEPTSTYGDPLRFALLARGVPVFRVSPKRCHDAAEVFDGVPSRHDPKSAEIIARLHLGDCSEPWPLRTDEERELGAAIRTMAMFDDQEQRDVGRLEAQLARHWPEVTRLLKLTSATLLEVLSTFGGPADVAASETKARKLMRQVGRHFLTDDKIDDVIRSARRSHGVPMLAQERSALMALARDTRRASKAADRAHKRVEQLSQGRDSTNAMGATVGQVTAAVLVTEAGDPWKFASPAAYVKAYGLNLTEISSGKHKGELSISKRGSGMARRYLFLASLRLIERDGLVRSWYHKRLRRNGGKKKKGVVAVMRKYARALWHVARGAVFDSRLLFDAVKLAWVPADAPELA